MAILEVKELKKHFGTLKAVDGISFSLNEGEVLGIVGESGSGKSTAARATIRLIEPSSGSITFDGKNLLALSRKQLRALRPQMQMVFQDPLSSLNPRKSILTSLGEPLLYHSRVSCWEEARERLVGVLDQVGMDSGHLKRYPHQFSGGQQQRLCIARALALEPRLIVCDEVVSALDVSVQAQILNLLADIGGTYLFISHDLAVVRHLCDRVLVLHLGKVVEEGPTEAIFEDPKHPYTQTLLAAIPQEHPKMVRQ